MSLLGVGGERGSGLVRDRTARLEEAGEGVAGSAPREYDDDQIIEVHNHSPSVGSFAFFPFLPFLPLSFPTLPSLILSETADIQPSGSGHTLYSRMTVG